MISILYLIDAIKYHDNYLLEINFNNYYVTNYFKEIDKRRMRERRKNILPIRSIESDKIVDLDSTNTLRREFQGYVGLTLRLILHIIGASFFIALDRLYYELLDIIQRHSRIDYEQEGYHYMNITVNGTGFAANLIRMSVDGFNINKNVDYMLTNEACLPRPTLTKSLTIAQIYLLFLLNLYLIYNQVYIHRFKRLMCGYFYPKREKNRILHLYNKMLMERKRMLDSLLQTAKLRNDVMNKRKWLQVFMASGY